MVENGLVDEVRKLAGMGYGFSLASMSGIGYRQIGEYLQDKLDFESAIKKIKTETHRFVRHQYNWFRLSDDRIQWFDVADAETESKVAAAVASFIKAAWTVAVIPGLAFRRDDRERLPTDAARAASHCAAAGHPY